MCVGLNFNPPHDYYGDTHWLVVSGAGYYSCINQPSIQVEEKGSRKCFGVEGGWLIVIMVIIVYGYTGSLFFRLHREK